MAKVAARATLAVLLGVIMEVSSDNHEVHGPGPGRYWYSNQGISGAGRTVEVNIFADSKAEADAIGTGIAIARDHHCNKGAEYVATKEDYYDTFS